MFYAVKKRKAIEPLIATILLVVIAVILVTIVLTWGKEFSTSSLDKTNNFGELKASDATHFVYPKSASQGIVQFTYSPPTQISQDINITHYRVLNIPEMTEPIALEEPVVLSPSLNVLELPCLYEYSTTTPDLTIQLITAENTYIDIKTKDQGMVCSPGGDGKENGPIIICNAEDLNNLRNDLGASYALGKDIDLKCFSRQDENGWEPIGTSEKLFQGIFDGDGYTISNLYINRSNTDDVGLFGYTDNLSEIQNLIIKDFNITGQINVGGLVGYNKGNISTCSAKNYNFGTSNVGGLVGYNDGNIYTSYTKGEISSGVYVGGLVGLNYGYIHDSYSEATASGTIGIGGLVGYNRQSINYSYSIGRVSGNQSVGGLVGKRDTLGASVTNFSYWDLDTSERLTSSGGSGKTTTQMKTQSTFTGWDFSNIWAIDSSTNNGYPYLRNNPPR